MVKCSLSNKMLMLGDMFFSTPLHITLVVEEKGTDMDRVEGKRSSLLLEPLPIMSSIKISPHTSYPSRRHQSEVLEKFVKEWDLHILCGWNKLEIKTLSLNDLFNNLKAYESEVKETSNSTINSHNVSFLSSSITNSTTGAVNTAQGVNTASTQGAADSLPTVTKFACVVYLLSFFASQPSYST
ncbi:hypothetical protein Tco_1283846 [Tanacetum coccineum]